MNRHPNPHQVRADAAEKLDTAAADKLSEAELAGLVARIRVGDREALGQLYRATRPAVTRYLARRMDVCPADVEDVVQETFIRAPAMAADFSPGTSEVGAWLCGWVARWTLIDHYRNQRFVQHSAVDVAIDTARRAPFESTHERESRPLSARVVTALARLTPAQRRAVQLRYLDGYPNRAAAQVAGTTPGALATNCQTGRKKLATELADLAPQPVSWVATLPKAMAVRAAFAEVGPHDVPAAVAWLRRHGVTVDESYAYQIRKGAHPPRQATKEPAVRDALTEVGACDAAAVQARLRQRGVEVSKSYINRVRAEAGAPLPAAKNTVVRAALGELDTTDAATVQAHLRDRGVEVSQSYINQVRRTPARTTPPTGLDPVNTVDASVDTSASHHQATPAAEVGGDGAADTTVAALARAREAVARIPATRTDRPRTPPDRWYGHHHDHTSREGERAARGDEQLVVSA